MRRVILILLLWALPAAARGQTQEEREAAKIHFEAGEQHYLRGKYAEAVLELKEAYRLSRAPALLFNIAQAYEKAGDPRNAKDYLQQYIDSGQTDAGELPKLHEQMKLLDEQIARLPPPAPEPTPEPRREVDIVPGPFGLWKWVALGAGVVFAGTAVYFALDARSQADKIDRLADRDPLNVYDEELDAAYRRGERSNTLALVTGGLAVGLVATGVVLLVLDRPREQPRKHALVPQIMPGGAGAALLVQF